MEEVAATTLPSRVTNNKEVAVRTRMVEGNNSNRATMLLNSNRTMPHKETRTRDTTTSSHRATKEVATTLHSKMVVILTREAKDKEDMADTDR
jgi:hypothetical protein